MPLTALPVGGFGALGQGHDVVVGEHPGLVGGLPARPAQGLVTRVAEVHTPRVLEGQTDGWRDGRQTGR